MLCSAPRALIRGTPRSAPKRRSPTGAPAWPAPIGGGGPCRASIGRRARSHRYTGPWNHRTARPVLVIGNTYDPATPYLGAVTMVRRLARARLLTVDGYGHTALTNPSACVERYMTRYFIHGSLPQKGARCRQNQQPFATVP